MLRVTEIFYSLQGEAATSGWPTVFIRLTGCPMRCVYCDTAYAFHGGEKQSIDEIIEQVDVYGARYVTVTGGEPLAQPACLELLTSLCDCGYSVSLETGNAVDITGVDPRVNVVLDIKTPGSGEETANRYANLNQLKDTDQIKFVLCDEADYRWALTQLEQWQLADQFDVLFSPVWEKLPAAELADWVLRDRIPVRVQVQLHKVLWGDVRGR